MSVKVKKLMLFLMVAGLGSYFVFAGCGGSTSTGGTTSDGTSSSAGSSDGGSTTSGTTSGGTTTSGSTSSGSTSGSVTSRGSGTPSTDSITSGGTLPDSTGLFTVSSFGTTRARTTSDPISIYRPSRTANLPLILAFTGSGNTTNDILSSLGVGGDGSLIDTTEPAIFIAIPNSTQAADWDHDGGGTYFDTTTDNVDTNADLVAVRQVIKAAISDYSVDPTRVYTIGFSNGAFMAAYVAMSLPTRIAAFAERSGGWARCLPGGFKAGTVFTSSSTTCSTILSAASSTDYGCTSSPAQPFDSLLSGTNRVPGYLSHDNQDDSVSVYYTCDLYQQMTSAGYTVGLDIRHLSDDAGGRHGVPSDFITNAWDFLRTKSL